MGVCYMKKGDNFLKVISFRVLSGIRTHDIQNHKLITTKRFTPLLFNKLLNV